MSYSIIFSPEFERNFKKLSKKYPSFESDLKEIIQQLNENHQLGEPIGKNCFKIRVAIKSKGKGKSAGARLITYVYYKKEEIYLLTIYDKSETSSVTDSIIKQWIDELDNN